MAVGRSYLFVGPEIGERNDAVDQLRLALAKAGGSEPETYNFYASETNASELVSLLRNASLFSPTRFFQYRGVELVKKKEDIELITAYLKKPADDTVFILISDETACDKRLEAAVPKDAKRVFWEMFENRKTEWIVEYFRRAGFRIDGDAVETILELVENNTDALRRECGRLALFLDKAVVINVAAVEACLEHVREESAFTLFSRIAAGDLEKALMTARNLAAAKNAPVQTLAGLAWCYRRLGDYLELKESGRLGDQDLRSIGLASKKAQKDYVAAAARFDSAAARRGLALIAEYDVAFRSGSAALEEPLMDLFMYRLLALGGRRAGVGSSSQSSLA